MDFQAGAISEWANDGQHFLLEHFDTICNSPSHIYHSALPLSPFSSWIYQHYISEASPVVRVVKGVPAGWGVCSRTALLGSFTRTLSHHNDSIAVGSRSGDIIILNAITGSQSAVLSGHTHGVDCVVFSSDGTSLVSGSVDKTVKLWDIQTGGVAKTFFGHTSWVWCVSISVDCTTIASGSFDKTIRLWNIQTGECYHTVQQQEVVYHVMFSLKDPQHLISISDGKVWQWDINGYQIRPPFDGTIVAFSSDGAQFVSCSGIIITVHDSSTGATVAEFQAADNIWCCCLSPDNRLVAVAAYKTAYCWDITTSEPQLVETFIGHTQGISSLIFPSSTTLISASFDSSVKFWQIGAKSTEPNQQTTIDLKPTSFPLAPIMSVTLQSKEGVTFTTDSDGVIWVWDISTGICKTSFQTPAKDSHLRDAQLVNGRLVLVWCSDWKFHAWDAENGELLWEVDGLWQVAEDLKISGDGSRVFCLGVSSILARSLQTGEVMGEMKIEYGGGFRCLIVDESKVWVCWPQSKYKGWDFSIQSLTPMELSSLSTPFRLWDPKQARIMNPATGEVVFQLSKRFTDPVRVQCDDSCLAAGYQSGEVLILDLTNVK